MKHISKYNQYKKVFESMDDIMDNFSYITDTLGKPKVEKSRWGNEYKYTLTWPLGIDLNLFNDPGKIIDRLKVIMSDMDDIIAAKNRIDNYSIKMSLSSSSLNLELLPNDMGDDNYQFIIGQDYIDIHINIPDIERFLSKKEIIVKKVSRVGDDENKIRILTSEMSLSEFNELEELFKKEVDSKYDYNVDSNDGYHIDSYIYMNRNSPTSFDITPDEEVHLVISRDES